MGPRPVRQHIAAAVKRGKPRRQAERDYDKAMARGSYHIGEREYVALSAAHRLYRSDGTEFTMADIAREPSKYHRTECCDPIEGMHYLSKNPAVIYTDGGGGAPIRIYSRAHGDSTCYVLLAEGVDEQEPWDSLLSDSSRAGTVLPATGSTVVRLSDVVIKPIEWLWEGHLARGKLELLTGVPGLD